MLPEGWKKEELKNVSVITTGNTPSPKNKEYYGGDIPFVSPSDLGMGKYVFKTNKYLSYKGAEVSRVVRAGSSLFTCIGSTVGKISMAGKDVVTNQQINSVSPHDKLNDDFIFYYLDFISDEIALLAGKQAVPIINKSTFSGVNINLPPLSEQKKIAAILSTWDRAIEGTEKLLANSQQQKKALMQQLLTGKKRLPGFTGEWETRTLGEIGEISSAGVDKKIVDGEEPIRLLNFTDVFKRTFIYSDDLHQWVTAPSVKVKKCNVKKGDVFFTPSSETRNDIAFSAVAAENMPGCCYSYHVVRLRFKEKWDDAFKAFIFSTMSLRRQVYKLADGSGQRYVISQDDFRSIEITYPSLDEQCQIGAILRTAENEITALKSDLTRLRQEKKALMQQLLTGKRRVTVD